MDLGGFAGDFVYIDVQPGTIDGNYGLSTYRVVAGAIASWGQATGCVGLPDNNQRQLFTIQVQNGGSWENYAWIVVGHTDSFYYPSAGTVIAGPTSVRSTTIVAKVDSTPCSWPAHLHLEAYNYTNYARTYEWDGPSNQQEPGNLAWGPACSRSGGNPANCETTLDPSDIVGYVGGNKPNFAEINNPYYPDF